MTRVCYFVQSHRDPEQVYRLVRTLRRGSRGVVVVLHDFARCHLDWAPLAGLPDTHLVRASEPLLRSHYSCQVQPYLDCIDWLEREGIAYDWLINMSAQDYPVTPVPAIEDFLAKAQCDGFLRHWDVLKPASPWSERKARARYWHRYRRLPPGSERLLAACRFVTRVTPLHFYLDYGPWLGVRALRTPFRDGFRCYGGWAWYTLRRECALYLREFLREHPEVEAHYRATIAPEESVVPTVLVNSRRFVLVDDDLRYTDYSGAQRGGSPRVLTVADMRLLGSGRFHFARKFELGVDREELDRIDRELLGIEPEQRGAPVA